MFPLKPRWLTGDDKIKHPQDSSCPAAALNDDPISALVYSGPMSFTLRFHTNGFTSLSAHFLQSLASHLFHKYSKSKEISAQALFQMCVCLFPPCTDFSIVHQYIQHFNEVSGNKTGENKTRGLLPVMWGLHALLYRMSTMLLQIYYSEKWNAYWIKH